MQPSADGERFFVLVDPSIEADADSGAPTMDAVIGAWEIEPDGKIGRFRANPDYRPADPHSAADPLDALFRLVAEDKAPIDHARLLMRGGLFDVALDTDRRLLIVESPDGTLSVVVATSGAQRALVTAPGWFRLDFDHLVELLPDGVDVFFNPGAPVVVRLTGGFLRSTAALDEADLDKIRATLPAESVDGFRLRSWPDAESSPEGSAVSG
jgi:hypothetical protein